MRLFAQKSVNPAPSGGLDLAPVCCDWMSFVHEYQTPVEPRESGRVLCLSADGEINWESISWEQIKSPSSDTSLRVKCDGKYLRGTANIGRFGHDSNVEGLTVIQCVEKWATVLRRLGFDVTGFGSRWSRRVAGNVVNPQVWAAGGMCDVGTTLTRIDLAGNFHVSDYAALCHAMSVRRVGRRLPFQGKYGPTWGYDAKRSNWWKAKLYDKTAEQQGKRRSDGGATLARFEVQLGSEYLKREGLDKVIGWKGSEMGQVIYGRFAEEAFRDQVEVIRWEEIPSRLRSYAVLWRDGVDVRTVLSRSQFFKVAAALRLYGLDVSVPCNVMALTHHVRVVEVRSVSALRAA